MVAIISGSINRRVYGGRDRSQGNRHGGSSCRPTGYLALSQSKRFSFRSYGEVTPNEWAAVTGGIIATGTAAYSVIRMLIKNILHELTPNSGKSLKDQVTRIEARVDRLYELMTQDT